MFAKNLFAHRVAACVASSALAPCAMLALPALLSASAIAAPVSAPVTSGIAPLTPRAAATPREAAINATPAATGATSPAKGAPIGATARLSVTLSALSHTYIAPAQTSSEGMWRIANDARRSSRAAHAGSPSHLNTRAPKLRNASLTSATRRDLHLAATDAPSGTTPLGSSAPSPSTSTLVVTPAANGQEPVVMQLTPPVAPPVVAPAAPSVTAPSTNPGRGPSTLASREADRRLLAQLDADLQRADTNLDHAQSRLSEGQRQLGQFENVLQRAMMEAGPDAKGLNPFVRVAERYVGTPYVWGGESARGFDCSGFIIRVMRDLGYRTPPHSAALQFNYGLPVAQELLKPGDLVFFKNTYKPGVSHVGIYLGNHRFIHAAGTGIGTIVSNLTAARFQAKYAGARRLIPARN